MPLYEYRCEDCKEEFESIESIKKRDDADCPECGKHARRLLSGFSVGTAGGGASLGSYASGDSCGGGGSSFGGT